MNARLSPDEVAGHPEPVAKEVLRLPCAVCSRGGATALERTKLWLRVQFDAFSSAPHAYLQAVAWRVRGLRVRSRNKIATLAGKSRWSYAYWIACKEPQLREGDTNSPSGSDRASIIPIIDCCDGSCGLEETLASLPPGVRSVIVGGRRGPASLSVSHPAALRTILDDSSVWFCVLRCGDRLRQGAIAAYSKAASGAFGARVIYADDDLIDAAGQRSEPHFKPAWNPELFQWHDFLTAACIVSPSPEELVDLPRDRWVEALVRRVISSGGPPLHLPYVLHHRVRRPEPRIPAVTPGARVHDAPPVTVMIPTRNGAELLRKCVQGVDQANYPQLEVIVVDNGSDEPASLAYLEQLCSEGKAIIRAAGPFNYSALNNLAVAHARGDLLCFLNNDVEMLDREWLALLSRQALRDDIGAVGARLLYPDLTVQHAGVFTGIGGGAGHAHRYQRHNERGYFERSRLPQRVSAVTAACLVVSKTKFLSVGGFDEQDFPVAFNDVDLCLKLNKRGWQSFYEPRATLIHHESKTRGSDRLEVNRSRFAGELAMLKRKWATDQRRDPFHHPHLSPFCEQFVISV